MKPPYHTAFVPDCGYCKAIHKPCAAIAKSQVRRLEEQRVNTGEPK